MGFPPPAPQRVPLVVPQRGGQARGVPAAAAWKWTPRATPSRRRTVSGRSAPPAHRASSSSSRRSAPSARAPSTSRPSPEAPARSSASPPTATRPARDPEERDTTTCPSPPRRTSGRVSTLPSNPSSPSASSRASSSSSTFPSPRDRLRQGGGSPATPRPARADGGGVPRPRVDRRRRRRRHPEWCRSLDLALVAADELRHETAQPDRDQRGLPPGETREVLPTRLDATASWGAVARVHRRHGTSERILRGEEIEFWGERVRAVAPRLRGKGPVWVAWGTDWGDAPLVNAAALATAAGENVALDWAAQRARGEDGRRGIIRKGGGGEGEGRGEDRGGGEGRGRGEAEAVETAAETAPVASRVRGGGDAGGTSAIGSSRSRVVTPVGNGDEDGDATRGNAASGRKRDAGCSASGAPSAKRAESSTIARMFAKHTS